MDTEILRESIQRLSALARELASADIRSRSAFNQWKKKPANQRFIAQTLGYTKKAGMPEAHTLLSASFSPEFPLVMFNYSPAAHNTLYEYPDGWTSTLRCCRGIIFELSEASALVGMGFDKFFNYGEHPESRDLPDEPWIATDKHDGHLGIIFFYRGSWRLTTRGSFESPSAQLGQKTLNRLLRRKAHRYWRDDLNHAMCILVEMVGPDTYVHVQYPESQFILIGARNVVTLKDYNHEQLKVLGGLLNLPVTEAWDGSSIDELVTYMQDLSVRGKEGFVVRFASGVRVKFKFASYINLMVESKLSHTYIMNRVMSGNLDRMVRNLPEEVRGRAQQMLGAITYVLFMPGTQKERWTYLYGLVEPEKATAYYKQICRTFVRFVDDHLASLPRG